MFHIFIWRNGCGVKLEKNRRDVTEPLTHCLVVRWGVGVWAGDVTRHPLRGDTKRHDSTHLNSRLNKHFDIWACNWVSGSRCLEAEWKFSLGVYRECVWNYGGNGRKHEMKMTSRTTGAHWLWPRWRAGLGGRDVTPHGPYPDSQDDTLSRFWESAGDSRILPLSSHRKHFSHFFSHHLMTLFLWQNWCWLDWINFALWLISYVKCDIISADCLWRLVKLLSSWRRLIEPVLFCCCWNTHPLR